MTDTRAPQDAGAAAFGRVDPDGTVYVRTAEGERSVGQVPDVPADEALAFFTRRFEALELEVNLLQTRIARAPSPPTTRWPRSARSGPRWSRRMPSVTWTDWSAGWTGCCR